MIFDYHLLIFEVLHFTIFGDFLLSSLLQMIVDAEKSSLGLQLKSIQKLFSSLFSQDETESGPLPSVGETCTTDIRSSIHGISSQSSVIDLSNFLQHTEITLPTLNG